MKIRALLVLLFLPVLGYIGYYNVFNTGNKNSMTENGINHNHINWEIKPQEDFYQFANGKWLANTTIPADQSVYGTIHIIRDNSEAQLKTLIEKLLTQNPKDLDKETQKIVNLYNSFINEKSIEQLGATPIQPLLEKIDAIENQTELQALMAEFQLKQISTPFYIHVMQDMKKSNQYIPGILQSGLGLPDKDYYLKETIQFDDIRKHYVQHIQNMLVMARVSQPIISAQKIFDLEKEIARGHWSRVDTRNYDKTYNKKTLYQLRRLAPGINWKVYFKNLNIKEKSVIVFQPSAIKHINYLIQSTPLDSWKEYFKWKVITEFSPYLSKNFVDENFNFYGLTLSGLDENKPRYKRGIQLVNNALGEALGKHYVKAYFPEENKAKMDKLVKNLMAAFKASLENNTWMTDKTKKQALVKLDNITTKIGYPKKWQSYEDLTIDNNLVENVVRAQQFEYQRQLNKLGSPVDLEEWFMLPQMVNAYYSPNMNEIVFPAAILQPPLFNVQAPDALNYGAIGAIIGHEISHGFDDQGRKFDAFGNLKDWWTKEDIDNFEKRTQKLVNQYGAYQPIDGHFVNGELTLGENIADISGLAIAHQALKLAESNGEAAKSPDSEFNNDQLFFLSWAQGWATKIKDKEQIKRLTIDPHSPGEYRASGAVKNIDAFYQAFDINDKNAMYLPEDQRVNLWSFN